MKHWTDDDFMTWLYGLKDSDASHLDECPNCSERAKAVQKQRIGLMKPPEVSQSFLEAQRRAIYRRIEKPQPVWLRFRLAASVTLALVVAILSFNLFHPSTSALPLTTPADERLYSDLVAIDQSNEPRAIKPIEKLFEE